MEILDFPCNQFGNQAPESSEEIASFCDAKFGITFKHYAKMMVLWEEKKVNVKELGSRLFLDSGTLTPVLKRLEQKGLITRQRDEKDERVLIAEITDEGEALKERAVEVPHKMAGCVRLDENDAKELYRILHTLLMGFEE